MNFYKRYMGDYGRDTGQLSLAQHGAYTLLLDHYYSTSQALPADMDTLYRICGAISKPEQQAVVAVAKKFFPLASDGLRHNARADLEIEKWEAKAEANRQAGRLGGRPKRNPNVIPFGNPNGSRAETQTLTQTASEQKPTSKPTNNPLQNPEEEKNGEKTPAKVGGGTECH